GSRGEAAGDNLGRRSHPTTTPMQTVQQAVERVYREHSGRVLATLIRHLGDFTLAEDALQEAFESALAAWRARGVPNDPAAWIITTARRKAIDRLRRDANLAGKQATLLALAQLEQQTKDEEAQVSSTIPDDRLRLIFTCCHPA